jgi:hypothetical protein
VVRTCKLDAINAQMVSEILDGRTTLIKVAPNQPVNDNGTMIAAGDRITVEDVPGLEKLPHIVRFFKNDASEDRLRLLYCSKC